MRWGLSPVFIYECLANSRRWQTYAIRAAGVAIIVTAISSIALTRGSASPLRAWQEYAALGETYFYTIIGVVLTLVMLAAPAATAGAICVDRARGTLTHMLVTDLTDPEIVLSKLAARLLPILGLVACTWPVLAICSLLGGIDPTALTLAFLIILAVALFGCALAIALSVWARMPYESVLVVYAFWIVLLLIWPIWYALSLARIFGGPPAWTLVLNAYYLAFAPYSAPTSIGFWEYACFVSVALVASALLILLAVWRMRPVARRGSVDDPRAPDFGALARLARWLPAPSLDRNPVLWREWHRSRPSRWLLVLVLLIGGATSVACALGISSIWVDGVDFMSQSMGPVTGIFGSMLQLLFGLLMLSVIAPMSLSEERQRGSLDLLATTALSTRAIVIGKWLGAFRLVFLLAICPGLVSFALATAHHVPETMPAAVRTLPDYYLKLPRSSMVLASAFIVATVLAHGALLASIGLALATWIKRQSRAIAISVALAVLISGGWPFLVTAMRIGMPGQGISSLSPLVAVINLYSILMTRFFIERNNFWWVAFWDIECAVLALGMLWLSIRTFDGCFGRISERPRRTPVLSDFIMVLGAILGFGGLFGAITLLAKGFGEFGVHETGIVAYAVLLTVGFGLLCALAPLSISMNDASHAPAAEAAPAAIDRSTFARRWWENFRLVLVLAIGPALFAPALALARVPVHVIPKVTKLPNGVTEKIETHGSGRTYVEMTDPAGNITYRFPTPSEIAAATPVMPKPPVWNYLGTALLAVLTILVQGGAFVSFGLALGITIKNRARAIAASVCVLVCLAIVWPVFWVALAHPAYPWEFSLSSLPGSFASLLIHMRRAEMLYRVFAVVSGWNAMFIVMSVVVVALTLRSLNPRPAGKLMRNPRARSVHTAETPLSAG